MIDKQVKRNTITLLISWLYENEEYGDDWSTEITVLEDILSDLDSEEDKPN